jgi:hypothetical protein
MKAHRRNGIPTLMLNGGGAPSTEAERIARQIGLYSKRAFKPTFDYLLDVGNLASKASRYVFDPYVDLAKDLAQKEFERERRLRASFEEQEMNRRANALAGIRRGIPGLLTPSDPDQLKTARGIARKVAPIPSMQDYRNAARSPSYEESITDALISASRAEANSQLPPNFLEPIKEEAARLEALRDPFSEQAMSVQDELLKSAVKSSQANRANLAKAQAEAKTQTQRAADALSGGVLRPQTTSAPAAAEAAPQEQEGLAGTATTPAEAAATPAATVAPEGPEEEALRQATGAPTQAEEAAAAAAEKGSPTPTTNPTVVTSIQSTISDIMGNEKAQFDEGKRLQELKDTFGLGLTDMEKAAPGLAFAFSLMGAQRAPGESPFNALVRAAGSAGEAATKSNLALKQRERAIDSSLASRVFREKEVAEQYARNREWVAIWNGGFDERGVPQAEYLRMNADQIQKANEAGLQIVPLNVVSSATTAFVSRSNAALDGRIKLDERLEDAAKGTSTSLSIGGKDYKATSVQSADGKTFVIPDDVAGVANTLNSTISDTAETISLINQMRSLAPSVAGLGNVTAAGVGRFASLFGVSKEDELSSEQLAQKIYAKANSAWNVGSLRGLMSETDASKVSSEMSREEIGDIFGQDAADAYDDKEKLNSIISKKLPQLTGISQMPERAENEDKTTYEKRVRFKAIQNALAAQLAPILLGESGRTISDADRVRVIALLGGFADFSKAGVLTTEEEMNESINELERIIRKYQSASKQDAETLLTRLDEASTSPSFSRTRGYIYTPDSATSMAVGRLAENYRDAFLKETPGQAGQPSGVTTYSVSELS